MELERIFSAEQIKIHPDLPKIIKDYTKAVIKENPNDVIDFSYNYFKSIIDTKEKKRLELIELEEKLAQAALAEEETS